MNKTIIAIFFALLCWSSCAEKTATPGAPAKRDTSINIQNAFSELKLDSQRLEQYISKNNLEDSAAHFMRDFYNSRNYYFAWFTNDGVAEQTLAFWNLHNHFISYTRDSSFANRELHKYMKELLERNLDVFQQASDQLSKVELQLSHHFYEYAHYAYGGRVDPEELQWHIPRKKVNAIALLDTLIANKGRNLEAIEPLSTSYRALKKELLDFYTIEKSGGWIPLEPGKKSYRLGDSSTFLIQIKERLAALGDYESADRSSLFTPEFEKAVLRYQGRHGLDTDKVIGSQVIASLNIPLSKRIEQMLINLERMRWLPKEPAEKRIVANIPEFRLHVFEKGRDVLSMDVVVGTEANRTVVFSDSLKYVVFSPYWNVPRSIVRNEIYPAMKRNPGYLQRNNMEQTGFSNGLPVIRQKPGPGNALGRVKFIFPNSYAIYFHDTPAQSLFSRSTRAFSHGCIRVAEPEKLAAYALSEQPRWTSQEIKKEMNGSKEKWVSLEEAIPVFITYFTAWVDSRGVLNFRDDIYGHDEKMAARLFVD